jgi:multidrug efflux pump
LIANAICNSRYILLLVALLLVAGLGALKSLPRMEDPRVVNRFATLIVAFPGATAERVEALVSRRLEDKLREIDEIALITSDSRPGRAIVTIELDDAITQPEPIFSMIRDKVNDVVPELPSAVLPPLFEDQAFAALTWMGALQWQGQGPADLKLLTRYARELESQIRGVNGTEYVEVFGAQEEEILLEVSPSKLTSLGLNIQQVAAAIAGADAKVAAGQLEHASYHWQLEVSGELDSEDRIRQIPLVAGSEKYSSGFLTRVGDVAKVNRAIKDPPDEVSIIHGKQGVVVGARMQPTIRVDEWTQSVERLLANFTHQLPNNISVEPIFSQSHYTDNRLRELMANIAIGFVVVIIVLLFTLGLRAALIVALSLPLTVAFTLFCMQVHGLEVHQISVTGLVVALGIVVDNAIVFSDAISRYRREGLTAKAAVSKALNHFWIPLAGSTITTILAFMPVVLMPGPVGEFVGPLALTVIYSLVGSYIISHTIVAGLASHLLPSNDDAAKAWYNRKLHVPRLATGFTNSLKWSLARPKTLCTGVLLLAGMGLFSSQWLTESFFPPADRDMFHIEVYNWPGSSIRATRELTQLISQQVTSEQGIESLHWFIGNSSPRFYYNLPSGNDGMAHYAQAMVTTTDFRAANRLIPKLQKQLDLHFTQAQIIVRKLEQGPPYDAPVELRLYGENLDTLKSLGNQLRAMLSATAHVLHTRSTLSPAIPKIVLQINEDKAALSGVTLREAAQQIESALVGEIQGSLLEGTEEIPIRVRIPTQDRAHLENIFARTFTSGEQASSEQSKDLSVTLNALASYQVQPSRSNISRRNGERINTIQAFIDDSVLPDTVLQALNTKLALSNFQLPSGYRMEIAGESAERDASVGELETYVAVIVVLLVVVLVASFNSFRLSALIVVVALLSACMGILCVFLAQYSFGFIVIFALMGLMGLAINSAIVITAELRKNELACAGDETAIRNGVVKCSRHIVSTTLTTVGGFMPLVLDNGTFWPPFAVAIAGGTLLTSVLSLYFVPVVFLLMSTKRKFHVQLR